MLRPVPMPFGGVSNTSAFSQQPGRFARPDGMMNAWLFDPDTDAARLASRAGIVRSFPTRVGTGPGQALAVVTRASSVTGFRLGKANMLTTGRSLESGALAGNYWALDTIPSLAAEGYMDVTGSGGPSDNAISACCVTPNGTYAVHASTFSDGSKTVGRLRLTNLITNQVVGSDVTISQTGVDRSITSIAASNTRLFVCTAQFVYVYSIAISGLTLLEDSFNLNGWASETVQAAVSADGQYLFVGFNGASAGAVLPGPVTVTAGSYAVHFRSGVAKVRIQGSAPYLVMAPFGQQKTIAYPFYEATHNYWRLSEHLPRSPRGGLVTALALGPDGSITIAHTNQGRGPNSTYQPDATTGYTNITRISADGLFVWSRDTDSILEVGDLGFQNDIPTSATDEPSIHAIAVNADGDVYAGGRRNNIAAFGCSLFKLYGEDGVEVWRQDLGGTIARFGMVIDQTDQLPVIACGRNAAWPGSGSASAHLFKVEGEAGGIVWHWDLAQDVDALCVGVTPNGLITYGTEKV